MECSQLLAPRFRRGAVEDSDYLHHGLLSLSTNADVPRLQVACRTRRRARIIPIGICGLGRDDGPVHCMRPRLALKMNTGDCIPPARLPTMGGTLSHLAACNGSKINGTRQVR